MQARNGGPRAGQLLTARIFGQRHILGLGMGFVAVVVASSAAVRFTCKRVVAFDCPSYWPISIFAFRAPEWEHILTAVAIAILFCCALVCLSRRRYRLPYVILCGLLLVFGTNLIQGWTGGFVTPVLGCRQRCVQYYHDAIRIEDPWYFLKHFEQLQPTLLAHSRTHPPGAVLAIYFLDKVFEHPAFASIVIGTVSTVLTALFFHNILSTELGEEGLPGYMTFLFILVPSIQVYYVASVDALIATCLLGALYFFLHPHPIVSVGGSIALVSLSAFLTFGFVFILPLMVGFEMLCKKRIWRSGLTILGLVLVYAFIYVFLDLNYVESCIIASALENPQGFRLFSDPLSYVFTRVENVFEIILFFGPYLGVLALRGIQRMRGIKSPTLTATRLAVLTLLAMFVAGAFRTGETARACLFIYPYLMFPVALYLERIRSSPREKTVLLSLVFAQTMLMQTLGSFFW